MNIASKRAASLVSTTARRSMSSKPFNPAISEKAAEEKKAPWIVQMFQPPEPGRPSMPESGLTGTWVDRIADNLGGQLVESGALIPPNQLRTSRKLAREELAAEAPAYKAAAAVASVCPVTGAVMGWAEPVCTAPAGQVKFGWAHPDDTMVPRGWLDYHRSVGWGLKY